VTADTTAAPARDRRGRWPARGWRGRRERWAVTAGALVVAAVLVAGGVLVYRGTHRGTQVTAYFTETVGVYPGSGVRVLGVPVGTVDSVQPEGTQVKVTMTISHGVAIPAGADAVVAAPSVVADRYVQLTPAYTGGPRLADGAVIPLARTATPVEVDQLYASLDQLANALGPRGVNKNGALSGLVKTGAANLAGNGGDLHAMITEFSGLNRTLGGSSGNLAATLTSLERFTAMLKDNNGQVSQAERQLSQVSSFLASDRADLSGAVTELATALGQVKSFIGGNRALIKSNVSKLASITSVLVKERASLAEALDTAPLDADDLVGAYDASTGTLNGRDDLLELSKEYGGAAASIATPGAGAGAAPAGTVPVPDADVAGLPPLPLPSAGVVYGTPQAITAAGHR